MTTPVQVEPHRELRALRLLVEQTSAGLLAFCMYSDTGTRQEVVQSLEDESTLPIQTIQIPPGFFDLASLIDQFPKVPRRCFFFFDVEAAFPNILGYLNLHREGLFERGHALVFWVRQEGLRRIAESAPDFWAWRSKVFDFRSAQTSWDIGPDGPHDPVISRYGRDVLEKQAAAFEIEGSGNLVSQLALGRRLLALRRFAEADPILQSAVVSSEKAGDGPGLAEALWLQGNSKVAQQLLKEAEPLFTRGLQIARKLGRKDLVGANLRQLSRLHQIKGDVEGAYALAIEMMSIALDTNDLNSLSGAYDQVGNVLFAKNDLRGAEQAYLTAARYEQKLGHRSDLGFTLRRLSRVYEQMGDSTRAENTRTLADSILVEQGVAEPQAALALQNDT